MPPAPLPPRGVVASRPRLDADGPTRAAAGSAAAGGDMPRRVLQALQRCTVMGFSRVQTAHAQSWRAARTARRGASPGVPATAGEANSGGGGGARARAATVLGVAVLARCRRAAAAALPRLPPDATASSSPSPGGPCPHCTWKLLASPVTAGTARPSGGASADGSSTAGASASGTSASSASSAASAAGMGANSSSAGASSNAPPPKSSSYDGSSSAAGASGTPAPPSQKRGGGRSADASTGEGAPPAAGKGVVNASRSGGAGDADGSAASVRRPRGAALRAPPEPVRR